MHVLLIHYSQSSGGCVRAFDVRQTATVYEPLKPFFYLEKERKWHVAKV